MRRTLALTIWAIGLFLLAAAPAALAQTPDPNPFVPADPERQPIGMAQLTGATGGPLSFPIFALSNGVQHTGATGAGGGGGAGRTTFDQVAVLKAIDATTARLWQVVATGQQLPRAEIALCAPGVNCDFVNAGSGPSPNAYLVYTLEDVTVIGLTTGGAPGRALGERDPFAGALAERVTFAFTKITVRAEGAPAVCWDIRQNRTC